MLSEQELTKKVSATTRVIIGLVCLILGTVSLLLSYLSSDRILLVLSVVVGIPVILIGLSLLFGKGSKGRGILSPFTLYLFGICSALVSIWAIYDGTTKAGIGLLISFGCFALAKKRSRESKPW